MIIAIVTLLVVLAIAIIVYPFLIQQPGARRPTAAEEMAEEIRRARDRVYEEIRALQQEYFLKNLTSEEYRAQLTAARRRAAALIKQQHEIQATLAVAEQAVDDQLRKALQRPAQPKADAEGAPPKPVANGSAANGNAGGAPNGTGAGSQAAHEDDSVEHRA